MKPSTPLIRHLALSTLMATAWLGSAAWALPDAAKTDAQANFNKEMAVCKEGRSNQDQPTCEREARNALAEAKKGQLDNGNANLRKNARARCEPLTGDDRKDCLARARGEGTVEGSVAAGGTLKETTTIVPGKPATK